MIYSGGLSEYERMSPVEDNRQDNTRFSKVYKAQITDSKKLVIIKVLHQRYQDDEASISRFLAEADLNLEAPGLMKYIDKGLDPEPFIITEYFDGYPLNLLKKLRFKNKKHRLEFITDVFIQLCDILTYVHSKGILHCDIKPSNIMVGKDVGNPQVRLIDFGQAVDIRNIRFNLKNFSMIYSSPELITGKFSLLSPASDIFSAGVTMYECITGRFPFRHCNSFMIVAMQLNMALPPDSSVPAPLYAILSKASAKKSFPKPPNMLTALEAKEILAQGILRRYSTAENFGNDLRIWLNEWKK